MQPFANVRYIFMTHIYSTALLTNQRFNQQCTTVLSDNVQKFLKRILLAKLKAKGLKSPVARYRACELHVVADP